MTAIFEELKRREDRDWLRHNQVFALRLDGEAALEAGNWDEAIAIYGRIVDDDTGRLADVLALARATLAAGRPDAALGWFERAGRMAPYDPAALAGLADAGEALGRNGVAAELRRRLALLASPCADDQRPGPSPPPSEGLSGSPGPPERR